MTFKIGDFLIWENASKCKMIGVVREIWFNKNKKAYHYHFFAWFVEQDYPPRHMDLSVESRNFELIDEVQARLMYDLDIW